MKKRLSVLFVSVLCALSLALMACGGGDQQGGSDSGKEDTAKTEQKKTPEELFVGKWKLATFGFDGITIAGDFTAVLGNEEGIPMTIDKDGTGVMGTEDNKLTFVWKVKDDTTLSYTITDTEGEEHGPYDMEYQDGIIFTDIKDEGTLRFSADGTCEEYPIVSFKDGTDITSEKDLIGDWTVSGAIREGAVIYGDSEAIIEAADIEESQTKLTIKEDGTVVFMDEELKWSVDSKGATMSYEDYSAPIKALGDGIIVDMSEFAGEDIYFMYSK